MGKQPVQGSDGFFGRQFHDKLLENLLFDDHQCIPLSRQKQFARYRQHPAQIAVGIDDRVVIGHLDAVVDKAYMVALADARLDHRAIDEARERGVDERFAVHVLLGPEGAFQARRRYAD